MTRVRSIHMSFGARNQVTSQLTWLNGIFQCFSSVSASTSPMFYHLFILFYFSYINHFIIIIIYYIHHLVITIISYYNTRQLLYS